MQTTIDMTEDGPTEGTDDAVEIDFNASMGASDIAIRFNDVQINMSVDQFSRLHDAIHKWWTDVH